MKIGKPFPVQDGFRIRVTATARQGEMEAEQLVRMYEAALDTLPVDQQGQGWHVKYERDAGGRRASSRRIEAVLLTRPMSGVA